MNPDDLVKLSERTMRNVLLRLVFERDCCVSERLFFMELSPPVPTTLPIKNAALENPYNTFFYIHHVPYRRCLLLLQQVIVFRAAVCRADAASSAR